MPNNTTNVLSIYCENEKKMEEIHALLNPDDAQTMDFNKISPMPEELRSVCTGGMTIDGVMVSEWLEEKQEDGSTKSIAINEDTLKEWGEKFGATNWYEWSNKNWGTKWDAYDVEVLREDECSLDIQFTTAWSPPVPLYEKLSEMFPDAEISGFWSDEGSYERERVF